MKLKSSIKQRWLLNNVSITVVVVLVAVAGFAAAIASYYTTMMRSGLEAKARTAANFFEEYSSQTYDAFYNSIYQFTRTSDDKDRLELEFVGTDGKIITSSFGLAAGTAPQTADIQQALATGESSIFSGENPTTGERVMSVSCPIVYGGGQIVGLLRYVTSLKLADQRVLLYVGLAVLVGAVVVLLIVFTGLYFIHSIVRPVVDITDTAKRIAAGSYGVQVEKNYAKQSDEIGELASTINNMSMQISQTEKMQSEFLSSVSHELRTPLTAISGWGETLLTSEELDPVDTRRGIGTILKETKRLTKLVEDLLEFSRIQDGRFKISVEPCDLRSVFEDTIFMYGNRLKQDGIELQYLDSDEDIPEISCDQARMKQVFLNILDNAAKYGGNGGKITCSIHQEADEIVVRIRDYGPGIPEEELPHVKMKFYKGSSKARGSGIGLAVCEEIVTMHNGQLEIANAEDGLGGCLVTIRLPLDA